MKRSGGAEGPRMDGQMDGGGMGAREQTWKGVGGVGFGTKKRKMEIIRWNAEEGERCWLSLRVFLGAPH